MDLEQLIEQNKTFKQINNIYKKENIIPGLYTENNIYDIEYLQKTHTIILEDDYFSDGKNMDFIDEKYDAEFVVPTANIIASNTFEKTQLYSLVFLSVNEIGDDCFVGAAINKLFLPHSLQKIGYNAFDMADIKEIYYEGSQEDFLNIKLDNSRIHFNNVKFNSKLNDIDFKYIFSHKDLIEER